MKDNNQNKKREIKAELYRDNFQNSKVYNIPKCQLLIADIPYNVGNNAFGAIPSWYIDGDQEKTEKAKKLASNSLILISILTWLNLCTLFQNVSERTQRKRASTLHDYVLLI